MHTSLTPFKMAIIGGLLTLTMSSCVKPGKKYKIPGHGVNEAQLTEAFIQARARFTGGADYRNIPGNEFQVFISSETLPQGKMVYIDPDDLIGVDVKGEKQIGARKCLWTRINNQLPSIKGENAAFAQAPGEDCQSHDRTAERNSVEVIYNHLINPLNPSQ